MKKLIIKSLSWLTAIACAAILVNMICFFYERPLGGADTPNGAGSYIRTPHALLIHGTEGYSIEKVDRNGYLNQDKPLADEYILMFGSSHTQGKENPMEKRYPVLVSEYFAKGDEKNYAYSIACDGQYFLGYVEHFSKALALFPDAKAVTIEIWQTDYQVAEIEKAIKKNRDGAEAISSEQALAGLNTISKLKNIVKDYTPLRSLISSNLRTANAEKSIGGGGVHQ